MLRTVRRLLAPSVTVHAHCDLPCGVYDPAQAKIEAQSVKACIEKYHASDDPVFQGRAVAIKEERSGNAAAWYSRTRARISARRRSALSGDA